MAKKKIIGTKEAAELTGRSDRMIRVDIEKGLLQAERPEPHGRSKRHQSSPT